MGPKLNMDESSLSTYQSPLSGRYATTAMKEIFSEERRFKTWRRVWIALAEAERELGLPIKDSQIQELRKYADRLNLDVARAKERDLRHDVMAHVHAYGEQCPKAKPILHLGATSCTVTDNADLMILREALSQIIDQLVNVIDQLSRFAQKHKDLATLAYTHLQPAQCTTVGKRACLWTQDLILDLDALVNLREEIPCLGAKGTTGTQASFLHLFEGDQKKVKELDRLFAKKIGFTKVIPVSGQTYPRKIDDRIVSLLSGVAQSASKFAADIRILSHKKEIEEPFEEKSQVGSSAMPYKQNPMRCERMASLARFVMALQANTSSTAAQQWFERTLDDSANRRLVLPEGFLATDAVLNLYLNVASGLRVHPKVIERNLQSELPFMASEEILMAAVKAGGDRQDLHEKIRAHAIAAAKQVKEKGRENDLLDRLRADKSFEKVIRESPSLLKPHVYFGRAPQQVDEFVKEEIEPRLKPFRGALGKKGNVSI